MANTHWRWRWLAGGCTPARQPQPRPLWISHGGSSRRVFGRLFAFFVQLACFFCTIFRYCFYTVSKNCTKNAFIIFFICFLFSLVFFIYKYILLFFVFIGLYTTILSIYILFVLFFLVFSLFFIYIYIPRYFFCFYWFILHFFLYIFSFCFYL